MQYLLHRLAKQELYILLGSFPDNFLNIPITKASKHFESKVKGFRINKLPKNKLYSIYFDEISNNQNSPLEKYLIENIKANFENTKIVELLNTYTGLPLQLAILLEKEIKEHGLDISPHTIMLIANYNCNSEEIDVIKEYHDFICKVCEQAQVKTKEEEAEKYYELQARNENLIQEAKLKKMEMLADYEEKVKQLEEIIKESKVLINIKDEEIQKMKDFSIETIRIIETQKSQLHDYNKAKLVSEGQQKELVVLNQRIESLTLQVQELQNKAISPEDMLDICSEILDDLKIHGLSDAALKEKAKQLFEQNTTITEAWNEISSWSQERIIYIVEAMRKNHVSSDDIDILDELENGICIKYLIVKSLKVLFFKYLEQTAKENSIEKHFQSEEQ